MTCYEGCQAHPLFVSKMYRKECMALSNKQVINVLDSALFEECHIKGSVNVPYNQLAEYVQQFPKGTELVVYCAHYDCGLSRKAWHLLDTLGYTNIYAYEGGIVEWYQMGYPVEGPCKNDFFKTAAYASAKTGRS